MTIFNDEFVKRLGFENTTEFSQLLASRDISTLEKQKALKLWQEKDGTKAGLLLLPETIDKTELIKALMLGKIENVKFIPMRRVRDAVHSLQQSIATEGMTLEVVTKAGKRMEIMFEVIQFQYRER